MTSDTSKLPSSCWKEAMFKHSKKNTTLFLHCFFRTSTNVLWGTHKTMVFSCSALRPLQTFPVPWSKFFWRVLSRGEATRQQGWTRICVRWALNSVWGSCSYFLRLKLCSIRRSLNGTLAEEGANGCSHCKEASWMKPVQPGRLKHLV